MNGPGAATAASAAAPAEATKAILPPLLKVNILPNEIGESTIDSILRRVPTHEPWPHHENLDPKMFKRDNLNRDVDGRFNKVDQESGAYSELETKTLEEPAKSWKTYSTTTDTFAKVSGAD
jgi:hypothetical protein